MVVILTADEFMQKGLLLVGFDIRRQQNVQRKANMDRFKEHFGSDPVVCAQIWEDLQTSEFIFLCSCWSSPYFIITQLVFLFFPFSEGNKWWVF